MKILASCHITPTKVELNGQRFPVEAVEDQDWKKNLYHQLGIDYPKFYKMDALAKMAFLGTEMIAGQSDLHLWGENDLALIFANRYASYDTDQRFIESYSEKGNPSPSLFVYTLPNILTGELAIRHKWYGENIFFILEKFDTAFFIEQINFYFRKGAKACLCGWVESHNGKEDCMLFLVSSEEGMISEADLNKLFKHTK
jgi:hypothetical protein